MKYKSFNGKVITSTVTPSRTFRVPMRHTHLDIQSEVNEGDQKKINALLTSRFHLDDFVRPTVDELLAYFESRQTQHLEQRQKEILEFLVGPEKIGSPANHYTAHYCGLPYGREYEEYVAIGDRCSAVMDTLSKCDGYLEQEIIHYRGEYIPDKQELSLDWQQPDPIDLKPWPRVSLAELDEKFRQVEYHLSIDDIALASLEALRMLFEIPHYTAWKFRDGKYSLVATVQGFSPEIDMIFSRIWPWVKTQMARGIFKCPVAIKTEQIEGADVRGKAKLQLVVQPGAIIV